MSPLLTRAARSEAEAVRDMHLAQAERAEAAQNAVKAAIDALIAKLRAMAEDDEFKGAIKELRYGGEYALAELQSVKALAAFDAEEDETPQPELAA